VTRAVEAVLVAMTKTPGATELPASSDSADQVEALLRQRFATATPAFQLVRHDDATRQQLLGSLHAAARRLSAGAGSGLFVLSFAGHGGFDERNHAWQFADGAMKDDELTDALGALPPNTEVVLVSDCCYGAGILRPGVLIRGRVRWFSNYLAYVRDRLHLLQPLPQDLRRLQARLTAFAKQARRKLQASAPGGDGSAAIVVAATNLVLVRGGNGRKSVFARCLHAALEVPRPPVGSYAELPLAMRAQQPSQGPLGQEQWLVHAEPTSAASWPPLRIDAGRAPALRSSPESMGVAPGGEAILTT
jgi:Caspase domain